MSRVTPPVTKLTHSIRRAISSSASSGSPSGLLDSAARSNAYLPRSLKDLKSECAKRQLNSSGGKAELIQRLSAYDFVDRSGFHTLGTGPHRPVPNSKSGQVYKTIPLMQGFQTSAPKQAAHDSSSIDYVFLPEMPTPPPSNPFAQVRVPLLPDNYSPDRSANSAHAMETLDGAVAGPEISIIASHPDQVTAAMSEVVGNDGLDVDIGQLTSSFSGLEFSSSNEEPGVLKELWGSLLEDVLGPKGAPKTA